MKLLELLFALLVPGLVRPFRGIAVPFTRVEGRVKPRAERLAEATWAVGASAVTRAGREMSGDLGALRTWAAAALDDECPDVAVAPALADSIGAGAGLGGCDSAVRTVTRVVADLEARFGSGWDEANHAGIAARLLVVAVALGLTGVVSAVTLVSPPAEQLRGLAGAGAGAGASVVGIQPAGAAPAPGVADPGAGAGFAAPETKAAASAPGVAPAGPASPPARRGGLPVGKGMWIWMEDRADGGDPGAIVARATAAGLTHLYVRTGTLKGGFIGGPFLDRLLPVAHANGIRVYGWDFPYLDHPGEDVKRAMAAIRHTTPDGHRIDGFSADIETPNEGTNNSIEYVTAYATWLRDNAGPDYPLIATVPNPTAARLAQGFPYATIIPSFDAVAPMVYWMNRDPGSDVANAIGYLSQFGKPIFPVGQAYDGGPEGGPPGPPGRDSLIRFLQFADASGASGASFWSYQHATPEAWDAIRDAAEFRLELGGPQGLSPGMIRSYQTVLSGLGFPVAADGVWGPATEETVRAYQTEARLAVTGIIDEQTRRFLLTPVAAPLAKH